MSETQLVSPSDAAWITVNFLGPVIWWTKALCALVVGSVLQLLPQPRARSAEHPVGLSKLELGIVLWSRALVFIGGLVLLLSVLTPINAFGPIGDFLFYPGMTLNVCCLLWCNRVHIIGQLRTHRPPELTMFRAFIAGRKSDP